MYNIWKYFEKWQVTTYENHMQWTARIGLVLLVFTDQEYLI